MIELKQLSFFLGCSVEFDGKPGYVLAGISIDDDGLDPVGLVSPDGFLYWAEMEYIKPVLRPLSDLTEDENEYVQRLVDDSIGDYHSRTSAEITAYLAGRHFDLFGWLEKGLAINATKKEALP